MEKYGTLMVISTIMGLLARFSTLRVDYRQYPGFPHGYVTHLTLGFIASGIGAIALPALLDLEYAAITFLALAAQQFRDIRNMERQTLAEIEETELVPRGKAYIEGIAKLFEARNYLAMSTAFVSALGIHFVGVIPGILIGVVFMLIVRKMMVGPKIRDIATVEEAEIKFVGRGIGVEDVIMMNIGEDEAVDAWKEFGKAVVIKPKDDNARATLANIGQRQAIVHDAANQLGARMDVGLQGFTPMARLCLETGRVYMIIIPIEPDIKALIEVVKRVPVLESSQRKPLQSKAGRQAAD